MKKISLIMGFVFLLPMVALADFRVDLHYGSKGDDVVALQEFLTDQGVYSGPISGNFYSLTQSAVKRFQALQGITPLSGYVGPITRLIINTKLSDFVIGEGDVKIIPVATSTVATTIPAITVPALSSSVLQGNVNTTTVPPTIIYQIVNPVQPTPIMPEDKSEIIFEWYYYPGTHTGESANDSSVRIHVKDKDGKYIERPVVHVTMTKNGNAFDQADPHGYTETSDGKFGVEYNHSIDGSGVYVFTVNAYGLTKSETVEVK